jgi:hypothetical protein
MRTVCNACRQTWVSDVIELLLWCVETNVARIPAGGREVYKRLQRLPRAALQDVAELAIGELAGLLHQLPADAVAAAEDSYEWDDDSGQLKRKAVRSGLAWWIADEKKIAESARTPNKYR